MIRIVGDICFADRNFDMGFGIGSKLSKDYNPFEYLPFDENDIWFGNLECIISDQSNLSGVKRDQFRVSYKSVSSIKHMHIYSVANNHSMQHGNAAYIEMLGNINRLGSKYIGNLSNKSMTFEQCGHKFGIIAFSQRGEVFSKDPLYWSRPEYVEIETELNNIGNCDFKIVYLHWGNEFIHYPYVEQKQFAHWLIDIGFDLVVGTHPHVLQGYEIYRNKYIYYSLGNFLFNMSTKETRYSAVLNISSCEGKLKVSHDYIWIDKDCKPRIMPHERIPEKFKFETLNNKIGFWSDNEVYYKDMFKQLNIYRRKNQMWILLNLHKYSLKEIINIFYSFIIRRIIRKKRN